jgi:spore germination protein GerM
MRRAHVALLATAVALAAACGVPTDDAPRAVATAEIPEALVAAPTTTTAPTSGVVADLYFLRTEDGQALLTPEQTRIENQQTATVLETLVATVPEDLPEGVNSAIPVETAVLNTDLRDGVLTVDLSENFATVSGDILIQAVAQIVYTATDLVGVDGVLVSVDGEPTTLPDDESSEITGPATRADYSALLPAADA